MDGPLVISHVLGELLRQHFQASRKGDRDCRLLGPGLTRRIAGEMHDYLRAEGITSYLVIGQGEKPCKEKCWLRADALTSKRIGSFVVIAVPGQLTRIQDSIRGSGGTIRSPVFSEEWPWVDGEGSESFFFNGPVLHELTQHWSDDKREQDWLKEFTLSLLTDTRAYPERAQLFLEEILGRFHRDLYPGIPGIEKKFLYHAGVPCPVEGLTNISRLRKQTDRLCRKIVERCQAEEDVREQAKSVIEKNVAPEKKDEVKHALDSFLDEIGKSSTLELGTLAFHQCWGERVGDDARHCWRVLDAQLLGDLFEVVSEEVKISCDPVPSERVISLEDGLASFFGEKIDFSVNYHIPGQQFTPGEWQLQVRRLRHIIYTENLEQPEGKKVLELDTGTSIKSYAKEIPLRFVLSHNEKIVASKRIKLHLCGEDRGAFVIVDSGFEVYDAVRPGDEEGTTNNLTVDKPSYLYMFGHDEDRVSLHGENDVELGLKNLGKGMWRSEKRVDAGSTPSGSVTSTCKFGELETVLCFEVGDIKKGEFSLEDELRVVISDRKRQDSQCQHLFELFQGKSTEAYPGLGGIDGTSRRRIDLADMLTSSEGWKPLLTDLSKGDHLPSSIEPLGNFIAALGQVKGVDSFRYLELPGQARDLLGRYSDAREEVRGAVCSALDEELVSARHPVYASHPIFAEDRAQRLEALLKSYLDAYREILNYIQEEKEKLEWGELFILMYLDCVVNWDDSKSELSTAFFLVGPWHPLVLARRFMVQAALFYRARRLLQGQDGKDFRNLAALLGNVQGFKWLPGISGEDQSIVPVYVTATSDPGWHLALNLQKWQQLDSPEKIISMVQKNMGLELAINMGMGGDNNLAVTCLFRYLQAFPSRRSMGIQVRKGYEGGEIVKTIDNYIHTDEGLTEEGQKIPGGVRLYLEEHLENDVEASWTNPPFHVYHFEKETECLERNHPDIYLLPPVDELAFQECDQQTGIPRGRGLGAVFSRQLSWLTEGQDQVPTSIVYEHDLEPGDDRESAVDIGVAFLNTVGHVGAMLGQPMARRCKVDFSDRLEAPWVVVPGHAVDPASLVKYVRDGADRKIQSGRALWDYHLHLEGHGNSYFVLSTIPKGFEITVKGFFNRDIASDFITDLGRIGIAIGGEALRSGRHALGIVGLIGAVRLLTSGTQDNPAPLQASDEYIGFIVPVDAFSSFFGQGGSETHKRADLLAVQLVFPGPGTSTLRISTCGVEAKLVSSRAYRPQEAQEALQQAKASCDEFKKLVEISRGEGGMPERLALLNILSFGLRITSPSETEEIGSWIEKEKTVYEKILKGDYEYLDLRYPGLLVSTEGGLPGNAEAKEWGPGLWARLTREHWPGISDSPSIKDIRKVLYKLFHGPEKIQSPVVPEPESRFDYSSREEQETSYAGFMFAEGKVDASLKKIFIGVNDTGDAVHYDPRSSQEPLENLNLMVTGSSGTGKTQFLKYLVHQLRKQGKNVLIIDMKNDFANDKVFCRKAGLDSIFVNFDGLPINPLIPYPVEHPETKEQVMQCGQHVSSVSSIFQRVYGLGAQQQVAVKNAIAHEFDTCGIPSTGNVPFRPEPNFPDLSGVGASLKSNNLAAYNRLDPLFTLDIFRPEAKNKSFRELVNRSSVLDLSAIPSDDIKSALAQLVVLSSHAYYNAQPQSGNIRQFLVFDEAHRVLQSEYMTRLVRECRAYGVGTILSSQYPGDFPGEISASMATKVLHGNGRDAKRVKGIVRLLGCENKHKEVENMEPFQALVGNRHFPHVLMHTMHYPLYLVWARLQEIGGETTVEELAQAEGLDTSKLAIPNLVKQLCQMGLARQQGEIVSLLDT